VVARAKNLAVYIPRSGPASVLLNCDFDKSNLVFGGPVRGSAVFGPADSERHFDLVVTKLVTREVSIAFGGADRIGGKEEPDKSIR
jgi:hypothetical protein